MAIKKETEETKEAKFDYAIVKKFANLIVNDYKGDFNKFLKDKKVVNDKGEVMMYKNYQSYYDKYAVGFLDVDNFNLPNIPMSFWNKLYAQSEYLITNMTEDLYQQEIKLTGIDSRRTKLEEIKLKLKALLIHNSN
jgi:hypothetical protein